MVNRSGNNYELSAEGQRIHLYPCSKRRFADINKVVGVAVMVDHHRYVIENILSGEGLSFLLGIFSVGSEGYDHGDVLKRNAHFLVKIFD